MSERNREFLRFYEEHRIKDQLGFYTRRLEQFDRATGQGLFLSATILGFASGAGALAWHDPGLGERMGGGGSHLVRRVDGAGRLHRAVCLRTAVQDLQ